MIFEDTRIKTGYLKIVRLDSRKLLNKFEVILALNKFEQKLNKNDLK